ncbi:hypothetical protein ACN267_21650 [Micromonospora sp. WMMD734]|uniref:hypothetical protein n=1 Tax=Micromonospora TaxID=1873 RepID=UPI00249B6622|nr:hypothetical protein [Micromonospora sp. WMMD712]WFE59495.1 hypothetical protein O7633_22765 [Micromonospora sp. WMMD712]
MQDVGGQSLNECPELTARYDALKRVTALRYGADSQAMVFVLYEELLALRTALLRHPGSIVLTARIAALRRHIQGLYDRSAFPRLAETPVVTVQTAPLLLEYSRSVFQRRYAAAARSIRPQLVAVTEPRVEPLRPGRPYMFVVDDTRTLKVWNRPFHFGDLVFGRNRATVDGTPVAHPMLVPDRLRVLAAGEIILVGRGKPAAVIVNTKSGHFRPPPATAEAIRDVCREVLRLQDHDIDIFTLALPDRVETAAAGTLNGRTP